MNKRPSLLYRFIVRCRVTAPPPSIWTGTSLADRLMQPKLGWPWMGLISRPRIVVFWLPRRHMHWRISRIISQTTVNRCTNTAHLAQLAVLGDMTRVIRRVAKYAQRGFTHRRLRLAVCRAPSSGWMIWYWYNSVLSVAQAHLKQRGCTNTSGFWTSGHLLCDYRKETDKMSVYGQNSRM